MATREENLFQQALEISSRADRDAFLEVNCVGEPDLLRSVKSLLDGWEKGSFLESTLPEVAIIRTFGSGIDGQEFGPYRIVRSLGRGGMASVFLAEQKLPVERKVAIKIVHPELNTSENVKRFRHEQQTLARMDHPNIAKVFDASISEDEISYFVMEFVDGVPILEHCQKNAVSIPDRLRLFLDCCMAIRHAHQNSVIHRDIKPSNVLISVHDQRPIVKVIDFGISKVINPARSSSPGASTSDEDSGSRMDGPIGTPQYMSPEQASRGKQIVDTRTDIYSLGALLYTLLTDRPPFEEELMNYVMVDELLQIVRHVEPVAPSLRVLQQIRLEKSLAKESSAGVRSQPETAEPVPRSDVELRKLSSFLKGDLDCIVRKAMDKSPDRRYATVVELAEDIDRFLKKEPILARSHTAIYRLTKFAQRRKGLLASIVTALLCLIAGLGIAINQTQRAVEAEKVAVREASRAIAAERQMAESLYAADLKLASSETLRQNSAAALELLRRHDQQAGKLDVRGFDWFYLNKQNTPSSEELFQAKESLYFMTRIDQSAQLLCCGAEGILYVLNERTGKKEKEIDCGQSELNGLAVSDDETLLATAGDDGSIVLWQIPAFTELKRFKAHDRQAYQVAWSPDGVYLATCGNEPNAKIWTVASGELRLEIPTERSLECLARSRSGDLAVGAEGGGVFLTQFPTSIRPNPAVVSFGSNIEDHCGALCFSEDGHLLASARDNGVVMIHTVADQFRSAPVEIRMSDAVTSLMFDLDAQNIAVGLRSGGVGIVQLNPSEADKMQLTIDGVLRDDEGRYLDGNFDGRGGDAWESFKSKVRPSSGTNMPADQLPPQIVAINPPLEDGLLPLRTSKVEVHFSRPIRNAKLTAAYRFSRGRLWKNTNDEIFVPSSIAAEGTIVTLFLPESPWTRQSSSNARSPIEVASELIHQSPLTRITGYRHDGTLASCGEDGRVMRFSPRVLRGAKPVISDAEDYDFGAQKLWLRDRDRRLLMRNLNAPDSRLVDMTHVGSQMGWVAAESERSGAVIVATGGETITAPIQILKLNPSREVLEPIKTGPLTGGLGRYSVSNDGRYFAAGITIPGDLPDESVMRCELVDLSTGVVTSFPSETYVTRMSFSPDSQFLAIPTNHDVKVVDVRNARVLRTIVVQNLRSAALTDDAEELLTVSDDGKLVVWDVSTGDAVRTLNAHGIAAMHVDVSRDGMTVATVGLDGWLRLWRRGVWQNTVEQRFPWPLVTCDFSGDGRYLAVMDERGSVYVLDAGQRMDDVWKSTQESIRASIKALWD